jgi:hypothetical protein
LTNVFRDDTIAFGIADVAQSVAHLIGSEEVTSSILVISLSYNNLKTLFLQGFQIFYCSFFDYT